jgi:putative ABC transport system ATP-binding protein
MSVLEMREVSKVYGDGAAKVQALRDVNLSVEAGAMVAVMGPSGSGKSTLLTIAGSLEEPTSGEVLIGGNALSRMSRNAKARLRRRAVGYVFQDFNLLPGLTAAENVALPLELDGISAKTAHAAVLRALEGLGLGERASRFPDQLSGGERQRVAIARTLLRHPRLLLLDEATSQLDAVNEAALRETVAEAARTTTVLVVAHRLSTVTMADRIIVMDAGQVRAIGMHSELVANDPLYAELAATQFLATAR